MEFKWRYSSDGDQQRQEVLAEIVSHAISRIELLNGKDSHCLMEEYKEWLRDDIDIENDVIVLRKIKHKL